ncbi:MAG: hypothetical protein LBC92_03555 [Rickettsiales bacterium]|jgi:hypothetical protein|nr:hypothetical protein [Rickettsiales bacterium]
MEIVNILTNRFGKKVNLFYVKSGQNLKPNQSRIIKKSDNLILAEFFGLDTWGSKNQKTINKAFARLCLFIKIKSN